MKALFSVGRTALVVVLVVSLFSIGALAAPPKGKKGDKKPTQPAAKEFNFDLDTVEVDVLKPDALMMEVLKERSRESLIRIRLDFIKEIVRSAEDI